MNKIINCPCCKKGILHINLIDGYTVDWDKPFREHTHRTVCDNCLRTIKYSIKKDNKIK